MTTQYSVTVTDATGEMVNDSVTLTVFPTAKVFVGLDETICLGDTIILNAISNDMLTWSTGETSSSIMVSPTETTSYIVEANIADNCPAFDTIVVFVQDFIITEREVVICEGDTYLYNGQNLNSPGMYFDTLYSTNNCDTLETLNLSIFDESTVENIRTRIFCISNTVNILFDLSIDSEFEYSIDGGATWIDVLFGLPFMESYDFCIRDLDSACSFCFDEPIYPNDHISNIQAIINSTNPSSCAQEDGSITITTLAQFLPDSFSIDGGITFQDENIFEGLAQGVYDIYLYYENGCFVEGIEPVILQSDSAAIILDVIVSEPAFCGSNNGSIEIIVDDLDNLTYSINGIDFFTTNIFNDLPGGTYDVLVQNEETNCLSFYPETIDIFTGSPNFFISDVSFSEPSGCFKDDGVINISVDNQSQNYIYSLDNTLTWKNQSNYNDLADGVYEIAVALEDTSCIQWFPQTIIFETSQTYTLSVDTIVNPSCFGEDNGAISLVLDGDTQGLSYDWSVPSLGIPLLFGIEASKYTLSVTDTYGCIQTFDYELSEPDLFEPGIFPAPDTSICIGSIITFQQTNPNWSQVWYSDNGFYADKPNVLISDPGMYYIDVINEDACHGLDSILVTYNEDGFTPHFLLPSEGVVGEDIIAVEISWPIPDSITWHYDESQVSLTGNNLNAYTFVFNSPGVYIIGLEASNGECTSIVEKEIIIYESSAEFGQVSPNPGFIKTVDLFPNPNDGNFKIDIALSEMEQLQVRIYNDQGFLQDYRLEAPAINHSVNYSLNGLLPGAYHAVLIANNQSRIVTFIVQ